MHVRPLEVLSDHYLLWRDDRETQRRLRVMLGKGEQVQWCLGYSQGTNPFWLVEVLVWRVARVDGGMLYVEGVE